ncbi:MAG: hypothetical protein VB013_00035 [Anaerolineaceae bacterium]|nr:hypothetical protein [Anaerolineaceae bacterium]
MSNYSVDGDHNVRNSRGQQIGKSDYSGNVTNGYYDRGRIVNDRYIDEYGRDNGWVKRSSSSSSGNGGLAILGLLLVFGIFYLMYLGIKWLVDQGKMSTARASRSWGIASLFFPPFFFMALSKGYSAKNKFEEIGDPQNEKGIANAGIVLGYFGIVLCILAIIGAVAGN